MCHLAEKVKMAALVFIVYLFLWSRLVCVVVVVLLLILVYLFLWCRLVSMVCMVVAVLVLVMH